MPTRNTMALIDQFLASLSDLAWTWERERQAAERYAALGNTSELGRLARTETDPTGQRALHPDRLAAAYGRALKSLYEQLRKDYSHFAYNRDPQREAEPETGRPA